MKELGMSWEEIKRTPRQEVAALVAASNLHESMHAYDGYTSTDISNMSKDKPEVRSQYNKYLELNDTYKRRSGQKQKSMSFGDVLKGN
jgi:hypothetical protein